MPLCKISALPDQTEIYPKSLAKISYTKCYPNPSIYFGTGTSEKQDERHIHLKLHTELLYLIHASQK
jgi:hypothetical protein